MPLVELHTPADRLNFEGSLTPSEIDAIATNQALKTLQTARPSDSKTWELLNSRLFNVRPDVELRVYGHYGIPCDLLFLKHLPNLQRFAVDSLIEATGVEYIADLTQLKKLSVGIYRLENFDFLENLRADQLTHLFLGATFSKKPRLRVLERFPSIQKLYLEGQQKDIEVVGSLEQLRELTLRSISIPTLRFLNNLNSLWSLDIKLGGTTNLADLASLAGIKYLELWQIKRLSDLSPISEMVGLQYLFLQDLRRITCLPDMSRLSALRRIYMENMKGLDDLTCLVTAPVLEELIYVSAQGREPQQFEDLLTKGTLKSMLVILGSNRKNEEIRIMQQRAGVNACQHRDFCFV